MILTRWKKGKFFIFLAPLLKEKKRALILLFFLGITWAARDIVTLFALRDFIDTMNAESSSDSALFQFALIITLTWGVMELCMRLQGHIALKVFPALRLRLRRKIISSLQSYTQEDYPSCSSGEIAEKVLKVSEGIEGLLHSLLMTFVPMCALVLFSQIILWRITPLLGIFFAIWVVVHFAITGKTLHSSIGKMAALAKAKSKVQGKIVDMFLNIHTVQSFHRAKYENEYLGTFEQEELNTENKAGKYMEKVRLALGLSSIFVLVLTLFTSFFMLRKEYITLGDMALCVVMLLNITGYMWYLSMEFLRAFQEYGEVKESFENLFQKNTSASSRTKEIASINPTLLIQELAHKFGKGQSVIQSFNLSVSAKEKVAIKGLSGAGKSTLFNLLLGHYSVQTGKIYLDGEDINHLSLNSLRNQIAFVPQQPLLFDRSIRENITYGNLNATEEEIGKALEIAGIPESMLEASAGEKGSQLSGGQRQQVAIARAVLKDASIYLLDEPTSAIDSCLEEKIISRLLCYLKDKTVIMITHDNSVSELMNRSVVL